MVSLFIATAGGCGTTGGEGKASSRSSGGPDAMPAEIWGKLKNHPCYSEDAHRHYARMQVAVAPACNIQCNYCYRKYDCSNESRPGVVSAKLTPHQAVRKVVAVASEIPQMTVLGIANPRRNAGEPEEDLRHLPHAPAAGARHRAVPVDQWPGAARDGRPR